ncbi:MAG: thiamine pyrophosphate-binding protein [Acidimicrobiales bacterium]
MTRMTPSEAFVETLVANGVDTIFGIMGSAFMDAMDIFAPAGIELVPVVHEQGAAHMADGYARVSGRHGVVIGQNGPGISNCVTAIAAAYWAHSPVVMITPEAGTMGMGLGGFQEANQLPMFQEFTKYQGHVGNERRMAEITARRFARALSEIGPTQLNIPRDRFYGEIDVDIPADAHRPGTGRGSVARCRCRPACRGAAPGDDLRRGSGDGRCGGRCRRASPNDSGVRWSTATSTTTPSRPGTRSGAGRSAIRDRRRR